MRPAIAAVALLLPGCLGPLTMEVSDALPGATGSPRAGPFVVVATADTGINPYHESFRRPHLVAEPCTYLPAFPCGLRALNLTLDAATWDEAFEADRALWESIQEDTWYWIPGTAFVAVYCDSPISASSSASLRDLLCILDEDIIPHGAGVVGAFIDENPAALLVAIEGRPHLKSVADAFGIPVDVWSFSWGPAVPLPIPEFDDPTGGSLKGPDRNLGDVVEVWSGPNQPTPAWTSWDNGDPDVILVGGGYADEDEGDLEAGFQPDVVAYFCRPASSPKHLRANETYCGDSFATPTVAGALSAALLEVRRRSGYDGLNVGGVLDPIAGVTVGSLRRAMNQTATYEPESRYDDRTTISAEVPLTPGAPWLQWGWGWYDSTRSTLTADVLLGVVEPPTPDPLAQAHMEAVQAARDALYK